jgi:hypothetical protein
MILPSRGEAEGSLLSRRLDGRGGGRCFGQGTGEGWQGLNRNRGRIQNGADREIMILRMLPLDATRYTGKGDEKDEK